MLLFNFHAPVGFCEGEYVNPSVALHSCLQHNRSIPLELFISCILQLIAVKPFACRSSSQP